MIFFLSTRLVLISFHCEGPVKEKHISGKEIPVVSLFTVFCRCSCCFSCPPSLDQQKTCRRSSDVETGRAGGDLRVTNRVESFTGYTICHSFTSTTVIFSIWLSLHCSYMLLFYGHFRFFSPFCPSCLPLRVVVIIRYAAVFVVAVAL